jgi:hypothetical protein
LEGAFISGELDFDALIGFPDFLVTEEEVHKGYHIEIQARISAENNSHSQRKCPKFVGSKLSLDSILPKSSLPLAQIDKNKQLYVCIPFQKTSLSLFLKSVLIFYV